MEIIIFIIVFLFIFIMISWFIISAIKKGKKNYNDIHNLINENTFEAYKKKYPDLVKDGGVECKKCGSKNIRIIQRITPYASDYNKAISVAHICKTCGHILYYSKFD